MLAAGAVAAGWLGGPWPAHAASVTDGVTLPAALECDWPEWNAFVNRHIQADGRVVDFSVASQQSTSEGQSYALFFALVANDRAVFERVLRWSAANLGAPEASGTHLPAWQWGKKADGSYGVLDPNSAADADLWISFALIEAGRLWHVPDYTQMGRALAGQVAMRETVNLPDFGAMLLPGSSGFHPSADLWRVNPSYLPLPLLRLLAHEAPSGPWARLAVNAVKMIRTLAPHGFVPDWAAYQAGHGFVVDPLHGDLGSYDAIRVYLWAGMTAPGDPLAAGLLSAVNGMHGALSTYNVVPEKVACVSGMPGPTPGPIGFYAALLPYLLANNDRVQVGATLARIERLENAANAAIPPYYDRVLLLFGRGWLEGRYRFSAQGRLLPRWEKSCQSATAR